MLLLHLCLDLSVIRVTKSENFPDSKIFVAKTFWIKRVNRGKFFKFPTNARKRWVCQILCISHTAPESVKNVKSSKQILLKNKMEAERLSQCWQKTLPKKFKPSWMPVKNGVLWWPELPPSAFVAFNLRKIDLSTIFVCYFLHVRSSVSPVRPSKVWCSPVHSSTAHHPH